jgi:RNA polymerase sigma factor (sigma-70 family)
MISKEVIRGCQQQKKEACGTLYNVTAPYVFAIIKNYIIDENYRKDVMQETYINVFLNIHQYKESLGQFKSWISKIAINQCLQFLRKKDKLTFNAPFEVIIDSIETLQPNQLNHLSKADFDAMLEKMPSGYRTVFLLSVIDDFDHKEISELLNISAETSRSQLSRAISWIKKNINFDITVKTYGLDYGK